MSVDPELVQNLFLQIVDLPPEEQSRVVDEKCGTDADLRRRVEALLKASREPDSLLDHSAIEDGQIAATILSNASEDDGEGGVRESCDAETTIVGRNRETPMVINGRYALQQKIGEGGMGEVWLANQSEPVKRRVALKLIRAGLDSKTVLQRFELERQALAMMDHPNIAKVFDGGLTSSGQPYIVMEYVNGTALNRFCDEKQLGIQSRLELFVGVCQAVQHAHQKGIVHRDLKPSNILVSVFDGRFLPKVIDFGVAKATAGGLTDQTLATSVGTVIGTLEYMAPEQAACSGDDVDTRADIYSLGVILYELLTGLLPFDTKRLKKGALLEVLRILREDEPPRPSTRLSTEESLPSIAAVRQSEPRRLTALLRGELDWVVMKCLEKQRDRRYETANALSRDIQHYLANEPVDARPPSGLYRASKFISRHKRPALAITLILLTLVVGVISTSWALVQAQRAQIAEAARGLERDQALLNLDAALKQELARVEERDRAIKLASERSDELKYRLGISHFVNAVSAFNDDDSGLASERLSSVPQEQRGWEWNFLKRQTRQGLFSLDGHYGGVNSAAFSSDGKLILTAGPYRMTVWDGLTGVPIRELPYGGQFSHAVFSSDGSRILACGYREIDGGDAEAAKIFDVQSGRVLVELKGHAKPIRAVAFSGDGSLAATGSNDKTVKIWNTATGEERVTLVGHTREVVGLSFSPDGANLVTCALYKTQIWDIATASVLRELKGHTDLVTCVAYSSDGSKIVTGSYDETVRVWDAQTAMPLLTLSGHPRGVSGVAFNQSGDRIAVAGNNKLTYIWDAITGIRLRELKGHFGGVRSVNFRSDGRRLITASEAAIIWDVETTAATTSLTGHSASGCISCSPDHQRVLTGGSDSTARIWDLNTGRELLVLSGHKKRVHSGAFNPNGQRVVTGSFDNTVRIWDAFSGTQLYQLETPIDQLRFVTWSPDGTMIGTCSNDGTARIWDAETGVHLKELKGHESQVHCIAFSPDSLQLVTASWDNTARTWDAATGNPLLTLRGHPLQINSAVYDSTGTRIITASRDSTARIWNAETGTLLMELKGHGLGDSVEHASFSPDGTRAITIAQDRLLKIWDTRTGICLMDLSNPYPAMIGVAGFTFDGRRLVGGCRDGILVWDSQNSPLPVELDGFAERVEAMSFSADGKALITFRLDGSWRAWDVQTGRELHSQKRPDLHSPSLGLPGYTSPDRQLYAQRAGNRIELIPLKPDAAEVERRRNAMLSDILVK